MFFTWNAFLTLWLFLCTRIGVNFGRVENCEEGSMNASATYVLHGSTVTLSCLINRAVMSHVKDTHEIDILQNGSKVNSSYGYYVNVHILMHTFGKQTFQCFSSEPKPGLHICGIYIFVGSLPYCPGFTRDAHCSPWDYSGVSLQSVPPDQPKNVSCIQYGGNGTVTCTWNEGRHTYFNIFYELQLTNGATNDTQILRMKSTHGSVDLGVKLDFESTYTVVVTASNKLGNAVSQPFQFTLFDIVKPHSPLDISIKCDGFNSTNCTVFLQDQQDTQLFRIRFRPVNSNTWILLENITARRYGLRGLKPATEYEFQVSCKFFLNRGLWSDWSKSLQKEADIPEVPPQSFSIKNGQAGDTYILWMTASTKAGESSEENESLAFTDESGWTPLATLGIICFSILACCAVYAGLQGFSLFSVHMPGWYNKAIPDPANSSWAKKFTSVENELSLYSSQFLSNLDSLEDPEILQIEEILIKRQSCGSDDVIFSERLQKMEIHKWPSDNFQEENCTMGKLNYHPLISDTLDQQQFLFLYKKVVSEEPNQDQIFSDYLVNPLEDTTIDYLPSTILPTITNTAEESSEAEFNSFNIFPRTFLPQTFSLGGKLTLDAIKIDYNSSTD